MTRVNIIPVQELTDQHLFAEYREITRLFALVKQACDKYPIDAVLKKVVSTYRLSTGHILFFYDKLGYIERRYFELKDEVLKRRFNVSLKDDIVEFRQVIDKRFYNDFTPSQSDMAINIDRLIEKIEAKPNWYKINGQLINDDDYVQGLKAMVR
ncbi:MAG: pyrimidine dimer DNA glycosylase/endonuclease V [Moraxella sp.]|nr:pyrimidine dimer DNA glycosylase/endonuclease V [Moraxella sp.]